MTVTFSQARTRDENGFMVSCLTQCDECGHTVSHAGGDSVNEVLDFVDNHTSTCPGKTYFGTLRRVAGAEAEPAPEVDMSDLESLENFIAKSIEKQGVRFGRQATLKWLNEYRRALFGNFEAEHQNMFIWRRDRGGFKKRGLFRRSDQATNDDKYNSYAAGFTDAYATVLQKLQTEILALEEADAADAPEEED